MLRDCADVCILPPSSRSSRNPLWVLEAMAELKTDLPLPTSDVSQGPGPKFGFTGTAQRGYGPEFWGMTFAQLVDVGKYRQYRSIPYTVDVDEARLEFRTLQEHGLDTGDYVEFDAGCSDRNLAQRIFCWASKVDLEAEVFRVCAVDPFTILLEEWANAFVFGQEGDTEKAWRWIWRPLKKLPEGIASHELRKYTVSLRKPATDIEGVPRKFDKDGIQHITMRDIVASIVVPATRSRGLGLALLLNAEEPLRAQAMVSHAWDETYAAFLDALVHSGVSGPFWVCAMAIYQPEDMPELTVESQLGEDPSTGPFATVLKQADVMVALTTLECNIYTRMWCVLK